MIGQDNAERKCIYIIGSYINACTIYRSIQAIGYSSPVVMIDTTISDGKCLADIVCTNANIVKQKLAEKRIILNLFDDADNNNVEKYILFTDETYMDIIRDATNAGQMTNVVSYTGSVTGNEKIFDRLIFYQFIDQLKLSRTKTPCTIDGTQNPFTYFQNEFVIRLRRSWHTGVVLPSVTIIRDRQQYDASITRFRYAGLTSDDWCFQELLSISDQHNLSVCGWHDDSFHQYIVTRKVLQHPPKTGNGDIVENIANYPRELTEATNAILTAMSYRGPFEMEFVFDIRSDSYKIIELNPRFWMQHGLFEELTGNLLVRKALNQNFEYNTIPPEAFPHRYWLNSNRFLYRLCRGQFTVLRYLRKGICYPTLSESLQWMPYYQKYTQQQRG